MGYLTCLLQTSLRSGRLVIWRPQSLLFTTKFLCHFETTIQTFYSPEQTSSLTYSPKFHYRSIQIQRLSHHSVHPWLFPESLSSCATPQTPPSHRDRSNYTYIVAFQYCSIDNWQRGTDRKSILAKLQHQCQAFIWVPPTDYQLEHQIRKFFFTAITTNMTELVSSLGMRNGSIAIYPKFIHTHQTGFVVGTHSFSKLQRLFNLLYSSETSSDP